jgi:2-polyprenyl-6-methoxyphenol hydroxylase-like FAD-dependent oxidoreductase
MNQSMPCDVIIVGGGPVGVITALLCRLRGLTVVLVERFDTIYPLPRADTMDEDTQRTLAMLGLGELLATMTTPLHGAEFVDATGSRITGVDLPVSVEWPNGYHPVVSFHQPDLEKALRFEARRRDISMTLGATVTAVRDVGEAVAVDIQTVNGARTCTARWVVAADGARSFVRQHLGVGVTDLGFDQEWVVADVLMQRHVDLPTCAQQVCDPQRLTTLVPGHGNWRRWEFQVQPDEVGAELALPSQMRKLLRPWITEKDGTIERSAVFSFHATITDTFRLGNVFFVGDAAHQMPPFIGQGLCTGIRDAMNLVWKLETVRDGYTETLLDTYDSERRPHARQSVLTSVDTGRLMEFLAGSGTAHLEQGSMYSQHRPIPRYGPGTIVSDHPLAGLQISNPSVNFMERLDDLLTYEFILLVAEEQRNASARVLESTSWEWANPKVVALPEHVLPLADLSRHAVLVRPDRTIASFMPIDRTNETASSSIRTPKGK